jgi:hypothetical protein
VTLSYSAKAVPGPVEVVVVEWIGHGLYYGPFAVHRLVVGGATETAKVGTEPPEDAPKAPAEPSTPPTPAPTTPSAAPTP